MFPGDESKTKITGCSMLELTCISLPLTVLIITEAQIDQHWCNPKHKRNRVCNWSHLCRYIKARGQRYASSSNWERTNVTTKRCSQQLFLLQEHQVLVSKLTPRSSLLHRGVLTVCKKALWDDTANTPGTTRAIYRYKSTSTIQGAISKSKPARSKADVSGTFCAQSTDNKRPQALDISCLPRISIISSFYFAPWNSHKCKLQLALSCRDSYFSLFRG